ncbi:uncharacterized protein LOC106181281 [Lingula anatina]|uniref:Uncharacterized protein LOC106181281 n=1 Tax=Lingula anatina TaxID=7574 RepID=A0A1S3KEK9_LINAN|nr:uncharacterized protein LOC106181281 [Lingula anatina]|eukprot:XP_013421063.1 uncharacterized protein LOC106181281 [Lingula anatina]
MMAGIVNTETKGGCLAKKASVYTAQERLGSAAYGGVIRAARNAVTQDNITTVYLPAQPTNVGSKIDSSVLRKRTVHTEDIGTGYIKHVIRKEHGKAQNWEKRIDVTFTKCETPESPVDSQSECDGGGCGEEDRFSTRSCGACKLNRRSADTPFLRRVKSANSDFSRYSLAESFPPPTLQRTVIMENNGRTPQNMKKKLISTESTRICSLNSGNARKSSLGDLEVSRSKQMLLRRNQTEMDVRMPRKGSYEDVSVATRRRRYSAHENGHSLLPRREADCDSIKLSVRALNTRRDSKDANGKLSPRSGVNRHQANGKNDLLNAPEDTETLSSARPQSARPNLENGDDNAPNSWTVEKCQKWMETLPEKFSGLNNILLPPIDHDTETSSFDLPPPGGGLDENGVG